MNNDIQKIANRANALASRLYLISEGIRSLQKDFLEVTDSIYQSDEYDNYAPSSLLLNESENEFDKRVQEFCSTVAPAWERSIESHMYVSNIIRILKKIDCEVTKMREAK